MLTDKNFWCDDCDECFTAPWEPEAKVRCPHCRQLWNTDNDVDPESFVELVAWTTTRAAEE